MINPASKPVAEAPKKTFRAIYADDMRELRDLIQIILTRDGHSVDCVADGKYAFEKLKADPDAFDLVITDHHMSEMNGLELVSRLRSIPYHGKVIVFSSELSKETNEAYKQLGTDAILYKPVLPGVLRQLLQDI